MATEKKRRSTWSATRDRDGRISCGPRVLTELGSDGLGGSFGGEGITTVALVSFIGVAGVTGQCNQSVHCPCELYGAGICDTRASLPCWRTILVSDGLSEVVGCDRDIVGRVWSFARLLHTQ